jgi:PAS domain S-box-containing protein
VFYEPEAVACGWPAEELRRATALGRYEDEGWRVRKDGTRVWANVVITAIREPDGELLGFSKVTRDLTERRLHEQAVQDRENNLRLLVEGVRDHAMFLLDATGRISSWNEGAHKVLGYREDQVLGQDASLLYIPDERLSGQWKADFSSARHSGFLHVEGWRCRSDGTRVWAETSTTLLPDEHGNVRGFVQIVHDLTERRRVETLEGEGRRIGEFIAMLSHELRNPLAPMQHAVAILQRLTQTPDAARCVELMGRQVKHMSRLVDDLLDVSRITSGKIRLELLPLELGTLVHLASEATRSAMEKYEHRFTLDMPPRAIPIQGDATRLTQVVMNLLTNAAKYTPSHGDIHLILTNDGTTATLQLTDNGIGMSEALLRRAFEPFVQGERTLDRSDGGLGIGLTLVKSIVERHGGAVAVASAGLGRGTTFTVTLPLSTAPSAALPAATAAGLTSARKVLVVDDNRDAADSVAVLLRLSGHEVQVAYDGIDGLAAARRFTPDVVLLDIGLPGTDGLEVARQIKAIDSLAHARLIAMTGYGQDKDRQATTEAGFALHLTKPVDADTLIKAIRP